MFNCYAAGLGSLVPIEQLYGHCLLWVEPASSFGKLCARNTWKVGYENIFIKAFACFSVQSLNVILVFFFYSWLYCLINTFWQNLFNSNKRILVWFFKCYLKRNFKTLFTWDYSASQSLFQSSKKSRLNQRIQYFFLSMRKRCPRYYFSHTNSLLAIFKPKHRTGIRIEIVWIFIRPVRNSFRTFYAHTTLWACVNMYSKACVLLSHRPVWK